MEQYYRAVILNPQIKKKDSVSTRKIAAYLVSYDYNNGAKLTEHSYIGNHFVGAMETLLYRGEDEVGLFAGYPLVWAGDYADGEDAADSQMNLFTICEGCPKDKRLRDVRPSRHRFIVNETKRLFVDTAKSMPDSYGYTMHPLPLLCAEGNGRGGGDYRYGNNMELVGTWARDCIFVCDEQPDGYEELEVNFQE